MECKHYSIENKMQPIVIIQFVGSKLKNLFSHSSYQLLKRQNLEKKINIFCIKNVIAKLLKSLNQAPMMNRSKSEVPSSPLYTSIQTIFLSYRSITPESTAAKKEASHIVRTKV